MFFQYDTIKSYVQNNIANSQKNPEKTISDLKKCGDLVFVHPNGNIEQCDFFTGEDRLNWLIERIKQSPSSHTESIVQYITDNAHQNGFLFAGQNGVTQFLAEKNITKYNINNNDESLKSTFSLSENGSLTYTETWNMPRAFTRVLIESGDPDTIEAENSIANVVTTSTLLYKDNKIEHQFNEISIIPNENEKETTDVLFRDQTTLEEDYPQLKVLMRLFNTTRNALQPFIQKALSMINHRTNKPKGEN